MAAIRVSRLALLVLALAMAVPAAVQAQPAPLVVDVQVVDRDGHPVAGLAADRFNVEVNGRRRRVVDVKVINAASRDGNAPLEGRLVYFLVVDASTFGQGAATDAVAALTRFVDSLPEGSLAGLVTFPMGPAVELTTDHEQIRTALARVTGQSPQGRGGSMGLGLADAIEFASAPDPIDVTRRFCGEGLAEDSACPQLIEQEAGLILGAAEAQARSSLGMIAEFASRLDTIPGRKVVVLASAGLAVSPRAGGRPDVGNLPDELGTALTRADAAFYTLLLDGLATVGAADGRRSNPGRDREVLGRWLDQFSSSMGGALVRVQPGQPGDADDRIARETASHYALTLEPAGSDGADRLQRLRVRVNQRGATVRARTLVKGG